MKKFELISTDRLLIRKLDIRDKDAFFKYRSLPEVYEYQSFKPTDINDAERFIRSIAESANIPGTWFQLAICLKDNRVIGDIGLHFLEDDAQVEIGYTLSPEFQGQGYAIEALMVVLNYVFLGLSKHRVTASVDPNNTKSISVLNKLRMRKEGHFIKSFKMNDVWCDDCVYAILKEEWIK